MKSLSFILFLLMLSLSGMTQIKEGPDGLFYSLDGSLYSGVFKENYPSGKLKAEYTIVNGKHHGKATLFHENGIMSEMRSYLNGKKDGTWISWNEKGIKIAEANYKDDKKDGKWLVWDENGIMRYDMTYKQGEKTGTWTMWDEKGQVISQKLMK